MRKHGYFSGYLAYRYGATKRKPVTLAPIFTGEKRDAAVDQAIRFLKGWTVTPFEHEGAVRGGLRAALCLAGHGWSRSDQEAAEIVGKGLRVLGAKRPSWQEGQRHHVDGREKCRWCRNDLPDEDQRFGFCSAEHARFARAEWSLSDYRKEGDVYWRTLTAARALSLPKRDCQHCGKAFRSPDPNAVFCSPQCRIAEATTPRHTAVCRWCQEPFPAVKEDALYCCQTCRSKGALITSGRWVPKKISPPVFDYVFAGAA